MMLSILKLQISLSKIFGRKTRQFKCQVLFLVPQLWPLSESTNPNHLKPNQEGLKHLFYHIH